METWQFCLDTIEFLVLEASFKPEQLMQAMPIE